MQSGRGNGPDDATATELAQGLADWCQFPPRVAGGHGKLGSLYLILSPQT